MFKVYRTLLVGVAEGLNILNTLNKHKRKNQKINIHRICGLTME